MNIRLITTVALGAALVSVGCNSGSRSKTSTAATVAPSTSGGGTTAPPTSGGGANPTVGTFSNGPDLNAARGQHTATVLNDGRVLVTGGVDGQGVMADSEVFDPLTNTWAVVRNLVQNPNDGLMMDPTDQFPTARQLHSATALANGTVLVAGGLGVERMDPQGQPIFETLTTAYTFNPTTNTFTRVSPLNSARGWHGSSVIPNGGAVLAGGVDGLLAAPGDGETFDSATGTFTQITFQDLHTWGQVVNLGNAGAMIIGGANVQQGQQGGWNISGFPTPKCEMVSGPTTVAAAPEISTDTIMMGANTGTNGKVLMAGGQILQGQALAITGATEVFDPQANTWGAGPTLSVARFGAEVAEIAATGDQIVIGGVDTGGQLVRTCEVYLTQSNTFVGTVDMATARSDFKAVTLNDGRVLVVGGLDDQGNGIITTELHTR